MTDTNTHCHACGAPLVAGTIAIVVLFGERLLPDRRARTTTRDFGSLARTLVEQYALDHDPDDLVGRRSGVAEVVVPAGAIGVGVPSGAAVSDAVIAPDSGLTSVPLP